MNSTENFWRKCSTCKKEIKFNSRYYECSVSTCTGQRTGYVFCSVSCWEVHLPGAKHRDAGAVEKKSPAFAANENFAKMNMNLPTADSVEQVPRRIIVSNSITAALQNPTQIKKSTMSHEVLVVVSKMKQYIRDVSEMNTADEVSQTLSSMIRSECDRAIESARADGRKTVMSRDFKLK